MYKPVIFVDVDEVCAKLIDVWLQRYNHDWGDSITVADITDWNMHKFLKPECGIKIYDYLDDPHLYDAVQPSPGAVEGVMALKALGYQVAFATFTPVCTAGRKFYWLKEHGFIEKERDYIEIRNKSMLYGEYMLDDSYDNVKDFVGVGWLLDAPWNQQYTGWQFRAKNWMDFVNIMTLEKEGWQWQNQSVSWS